MQLVLHFRVLLLLYIGLIFGEVASGPATFDTLPEPLRKFAQQQYEEPEKTVTNVEWFGIVVLFALGFMIVSVIGLWLLWRPARMLFTVYLLCLAVAIVLAGPLVESALTSVLAFMNTIISGLILGMIYFSPLREHFDVPSEPVREA